MNNNKAIDLSLSPYTSVEILKVYYVSFSLYSIGKKFSPS